MSPVVAEKAKPKAAAKKEPTIVSVTMSQGEIKLYQPKRGHIALVWTCGETIGLNAAKLRKLLAELKVAKGLVTSSVLDGSGVLESKTIGVTEHGYDVVTADYNDERVIVTKNGTQMRVTYGDDAYYGRFYDAPLARFTAAVKKVSEGVVGIPEDEKRNLGLV